LATTISLGAATHQPADVNKSEAIRQALAANPGKMPREVVSLLADQGVRVTPAFVSTVKFSLQGAKKQTKRIVRVVRRKPATGLGPIAAAVEFIRSVGGLEQAKASLAAIEELRRL
jgi:hypothetical protein